MAQFLPDLPLIEIFKNLGLVDLTRARAVSRRWRVLIDCCVKIDELAIHSETVSDPKNWFHLNKGLDLDNVLELDVIDRGFTKFNQSIVRLRLLACLKRLRIVRRGSRGLDGYSVDQLLSRLVKFTALVHLEIEMPFDYCEGWSCSLVHPNLKVLSLGNLYEFSELSIDIDCPRLEVLKCVALFDQFTVTYPETIKQLYNYRFKDWESGAAASPGDLEAFENVELYVCDDIYALDQVNIWSLPKLKELRVEIADYLWDSDYVQIVQTIVTDLIEKKQRLELARGSPKIYLNDELCSANLKESHPELFQADEDWTDDEDAADEEPMDDEDAADEDATDVEDSAEDEEAAGDESSMEADRPADADLSMEI